MRIISKIKTPIGTYIEDLTGQRFTRLTVLELTNKKNNDGRWLWKCKCDCGNIVYKPMHDLKSKHCMSCGCYHSEMTINKNRERQIDLTGQRIGHLTVIRENPTEANKPKEWICQCDCGDYTIVKLGELRRDKYNDSSRHSTWSCGHCVISAGEEKIKSILQKINVVFEQQKTFDSLINSKTGRHLYFDFYLPDYNCCIEYDGEQHFHGWYLNHINKFQSLELIQYRDKIKNNFCKNNHIGLIRIPYTDFGKIDIDYIRKALDNVK